MATIEPLDPQGTRLLHRVETTRKDCVQNDARLVPPRSQFQKILWVRRSVDGGVCHKNTARPRRASEGG